ncbi:MAG: MBL fold metallo-hydrolase [Kiritimatiellae bacterium]|nr:MBL fold metallo-hydrolase [Kiritimatiellia bacterium]
MLAKDIESASIPAGAVRLWWLGQAGFAFKTAAGTRVFVDPYLSDACERLHGFKRLSLSPVAPEEVAADLVVLTHEHTDHLDPDTLPVVARRNPRCLFAAPAGCREGLAQAGVAAERIALLEPCRQYDLMGIAIHTAPADHGDLSPTALCLVLDFGGIRAMITGDTSWRPAAFKPLADLKPDVLLPAINGVFGNMNHIDAAMLTRDVQPRFAIPCHYWMLAEQGGGDPQGYVYACRALCPETRAMLLKPGEGLTVEPR